MRRTYLELCELSLERPLDERVRELLEFIILKTQSPEHYFYQMKEEVTFYVPDIFYSSSQSKIHRAIVIGGA